MFCANVNETRRRRRAISHISGAERKEGKEEVSALFCVRGSFFVEEVLLEQGTGKTFLLKKSSA